MHLKPTRKQVARGRLRMMNKDGRRRLADVELFQNSYANGSRLNCPGKKRRKKDAPIDRH